MKEVAFETPWGWLYIAASNKGVTAIRFAVRDMDTRARQPPRDAGHHGKDVQDNSVIVAARTQLLDYLSGNRRELSFPVDLLGSTAFQRKVWQATTRIPYGRVRSYQWVASRVGGKQYARAVGMALGANPVPLVIPCHRVVAHDGSLGGFSCGLSLKRRLLKLEGTLDQLN